MSISKTYLYDDQATNRFTNLYNFLVENAVPDYFSRIEKTGDGTGSTSSNYISCYIGDLEFLRFHPVEITASFGNDITTENGSTLSVRPSSSSTSHYFEYAYKCNNGIAFSFCNTSSKNNRWSFLITKDNNGYTTVVSGKYLLFGNVYSTTTTSTLGYEDLYVINPKVNNIKKLICVYTYCSTLEIISMCPFVIGSDAGAYTPNAFYIPFEKSSTTCTLDIDGVKYMSNGFWCVKDE